MLGRAAPVFEADDAIRRLGVDVARRNARSAAERVCIDAAAAMQASRDEPAITLMGSIAATCLPRRDPGLATAPWRRALGRTVYVLRSDADAEGVPIGVPFGAKARIILLHLADGAIRGHSRSVEVQASMRAWMQAMGIAPGGMTYRHVAEQARRIASCCLQITHAEGPPGLSESFVEALAYAGAGDISGRAAATAGDRADFPSKVVLSKAFYDHVAARPTPLNLTAVRLLSDNSWALDLYVWLAAVLPDLPGPTRVSWDRLFERIDFGYAERRKIRAKLLDTWSLVNAVYPEARLGVEREGLVFAPSPPAAATLVS